MGCGAEDGALVVLQNLEPVLDIGRMIGARLRRQGKIGAQEGRAKLGDQFFAGIAFIAPFPAPELPLWVLRPVRDPMRQRGIVSFRAAENSKTGICT